MNHVFAIESFREIIIIVIVITIVKENKQILGSKQIKIKLNHETKPSQLVNKKIFQLINSRLTC